MENPAYINQFQSHTGKTIMSELVVYRTKKFGEASSHLYKLYTQLYSYLYQALVLLDSHCQWLFGT